jgi:hypothetical protein
MTFLRLIWSVRVGEVGAGQARQIEVATGHLVAGDREVGDGLVDFAGGQCVAVRGGDPGVEDLVAGPDGDHDGVAAVGWFAHQLGEDAVLLPDLTPVGDPGQVALAPLGRHVDGAQADDHEPSSEV